MIVLVLGVISVIGVYSVRISLRFIKVSLGAVSTLASVDKPKVCILNGNCFFISFSVVRFILYPIL